MHVVFNGPKCKFMPSRIKRSGDAAVDSILALSVGRQWLIWDKPKLATSLNL